MSIQDAIKGLIVDDKLIDRPSSFLGMRGRRLYVTPEIDGIARKPFADTHKDERLAELAASLDAFCELNEITVSENPDDKPRDVMLARVRPVNREFWSMRVTEPEGSPGIRVLGGFAGRDEFVALAWDMRENISDFDEEVKEVSSVWNDYFGTILPFQGVELDDYLTNYYAF